MSHRLIAKEDNWTWICEVHFPAVLGVLSRTNHTDFVSLHGHWEMQMERGTLQKYVRMEITLRMQG